MSCVSLTIPWEVHPMRELSCSDYGLEMSLVLIQSWWTGGAGWSDADTTGATGAVHWAWSLHLTVWRQHIITSSEEQILLQLAFSATYKELMRFNSDLLRTWLCNNMNNQKKSGQKIIIKECRFRIFLLKIIKNY